MSKQAESNTNASTLKDSWQRPTRPPRPNPAPPSTPPKSHATPKQK